MTRPSSRSHLPILGWREWVSLDDWSVPYVKAKVDTGARTSTLHAFDLEWFEREQSRWVRFAVHPWQRSSLDEVIVETAVLDTRDVRNSAGVVEHRPIVCTTVTIAGRPVRVELTLTRRDEMGFRMLLGRQAVRNRYLVDPGASYAGGRPSKRVRRRNREYS